MKTLLTPHITEKSYRTISEVAGESSTYTFKLAKGLDKADVKRMVERDFKVTVLNVRITKLPGKARRFRGVLGRTSTITKAVVQLKKGDRIAAFDISDKEGDKE